MKEVFEKLTAAVREGNKELIREYAETAADLITGQVTGSMEYGKVDQARLEAAIYISQACFTSLVDHADTYLDAQTVDKIIEDGWEIASRAVYG